MILAAGRGERMRPLTDDVPKALLPVGGRPLIEWHLERLAAAGFRDIVVNHAWLGPQIEATLGNGARFGVRLRYSPEAVALETAGGIANALPLIDGGAFPVLNADVYCDFDYDRLSVLAEELAGAPERVGHLILVDNPPHHPLGDFSLDGSRVGESASHRFTFSGIGVYRRELFAGLPRGEPARLAPLLRTAIARERLSGERYGGRWVDVGTPERLADLDRALRVESMRGC